MLNSRKCVVLTAMLSAAGLLPMSAMANISFTEGGERLINTLHTHLYSPSSGLSSFDEIKLAAVCFINDTSACSGEEFGNTENNGGNGGSDGAPDYDLDDSERCRKEGYTLTSCPEGSTPEDFCIYDSNYFARCICPAGYKKCEPPYYGVGTACGDKYTSCEKDTERACKEINPEFTDTCQDGWKIDPNNACEYDPTYGKCCNLCEGYDYTTIPEGYIADGAACVDCNGTTKYKIKINPCDGFQDCGVMGPEAGAKTCMSGSQIKYDNCKPCPNLGTLTSCPSPFTCTYEECSNRYYKSGCKSSYDWDAKAKTCTKQCPNEGTLTSCPYPYTCTYEDCSGKYYKSGCKSGYDWDSSSQTCTEEKCPNKGTLTSCPFPYTCTYEDCSGMYYKSGCQSGYGYVWKYGTSCICADTYKYTCTKTNEVGGVGISCDGKYLKCECAEGASWANGACTCSYSYKYTCSGMGYAGGEGVACGGKYEKCVCESDYIWKGTSCEQCYRPFAEEVEGGCTQKGSSYLLKYRRIMVYSNATSLYRKDCLAIEEEFSTEEDCLQEFNFLVYTKYCPSSFDEVLCM